MLFRPECLRRYRRPVLVLLLFLLVSALLGGPVAYSDDAAPSRASGPQQTGDSDALFVPVPQPMAPAAAMESHVLRNRVVALNGALLPRTYTPGAMPTAFTLNVFEDVAPTVEMRSIQPHAADPEGYTWFGHVPEIPFSEVYLTVGGGQLSGRVNLVTQDFEVAFLEEGLYAVKEVDVSRLNPSASKPEPLVLTPEIQEALESPMSPSSGSPAEIDVLMVYTSQARASAGGTTAMQNNIQNAMNVVNQSYTNTGIWMRIANVAMREISYFETGDIITDLERLRDPADGQMDIVHSWRNEDGADLVALITDTASSWCGVAYGLNAERAFSVVHDSCLVNGYTLAHEFGHNMGSHHDVANAVDTFGNPVEGYYNYSYGYQDPASRFRTIMAYYNGCGAPCPQINYFSNPDYVTWEGAVMGTATANNRRSLNNLAPVVAGFRARTQALVPNTNLLANGNFSAGRSPWILFGDVDWRLNNGVMEFRREYPGWNGAQLFQTMERTVPAGAPLEVWMQLGNSSNVPKGVQVRLRDGNWTDAITCSVTIPPNTPLTGFSMRGITNSAWNTMLLSVSSYDNDNAAYLRVDSVSVQYKPDAGITGFSCGGFDTPTYTNLLRNGDFSDGRFYWTLWGWYYWRTWNGNFEFYRPSEAPVLANLFAQAAYTIAHGTPIRLTIDIGNNSAVTKEVSVILRDSMWAQTFNCTYILPPGTPLTQVVVQGYTNRQWSNPMVMVRLMDADGQPAVQVDNARVETFSFATLVGSCASALTPAGAVAQPGRYEAEDTANLIAREGEWVAQSDTAASAAAFVANASEESALELQFRGTSVDILYSAIPSAGTLVIEIDGEIRRTVDTAAGSVQHGQVATVGFLEDGLHQVRVYGINGPVAIDAIEVE